MRRCAAALLVAIACLAPSASRAAAARAVSFKTADGVTIAGTWFEAARQPAPAVILLHMLGRSHADWLVVGNRLADAGVHALAIDFRGHGASTSGPADDSGSGAGLSRLVLDVQAAQAFLAARTDAVRPSLIGIAGASLGANVGVLAAAREPNVRSLALLSPSLDYRSLRSEAALTAFGSRPALLVAGTDDYYAARSVRELRSVGGGVRETRMVDNGGHGMRLLERDPELARALVDWFLRTLL
jgi:pimeloyl-ACP methyl ester carboxylesterase